MGGQEQRINIEIVLVKGLRPNWTSLNPITVTYIIVKNDLCFVNLDICLQL